MEAPNTHTRTIMSQDQFPPARPIVSVIVPISDHRGLALEAVTSWVNTQRCQADDFEVIVVIDETCQALEQALRALLRPHDVLLSVTGMNEIEQYHLGAMRTRGDYLFFTEPHCLAAPDAVTEIITYFQTHAEDGFCAASLPICRNRIALMEWRMFEEGWQIWSQDDHWCRVIIRGFGIRRSVYLEVGGFETRYSRFAEWLLAATLNAKGYRLGYAPQVSVKHAYGERLPLFDAFIRQFTTGECLLRMERPREFCERFFGAPPEWDDLRGDKHQICGLLRRILGQQLRTRQGPASTLRGWYLLLCTYFNMLFAERTENRSHLWCMAWRVACAKMHCYLWWFDADRMYRAFQDYWQRTTAFYRVKFLLEHANQLEIDAPPSQMTYEMHHIAVEHLFGFHGKEQYDKQPFRWSSPVAAIQISLLPATYQLNIRLLPVRPIDVERELSIFFNLTPIRLIRYDQPTAALHVTIHPAMFNATIPNWLILLCSPLHIDIDSRQLGLPIIAIESVEYPERNATHEAI